MINKEEMEAVKKKIEHYYYIEKVIVWKNEKLERLMKRLEEIDNDRNSAVLPFSLNTDLQAVKYDGIGNKGGALPQSPMERNIEAIYNSLESAYCRTQNEIVGLKIEIQKLEDGQEETAFYIHMLNEESKKILEYKYKYKKSVTQVAFLLHLSKSTICRSFQEIYEWLYKMMEYNGVFKKNVKQNETKTQQNGTKLQQNETKLGLF